MLASAIARWIVAIQLATAVFVTVFLLSDGIARHLHGAPVVQIGLASTVAPLVAAVTGILIVPRSGRRAAGRVFGGIPLATAAFGLVTGLVGHVPTTPNFLGIVGMLFAGYAVIKVCRQRPAVA